MHLRDHPQMSFQGTPNWPPVWVSSKDVWKNLRQVLHGEIGILKQVLRDPDRCDRIYLLVDHEGAEYVGALLFDEDEFCIQIAVYLQRCYGLSIATIGSSEIDPPDVQ
jgi:hypothetical protein